MLKPAANVIFGHQRHGPRQSVGEFSLGPSLEGAQCGLELCNTALNGIEVRGVSREKADSKAAVLPAS